MVVRMLGWRAMLAGSLAMLAAGCSAGSGSDFVLESTAPRAGLIAGFAQLKDVPVAWPLEWPVAIRPKLERPAPDELLFSIPSSESEAGSRIHMKFSDGESSGSTAIYVTIDLPKVGDLDEDREEGMFRETSKVLIEDIQAQRPPGKIQTNFAALLYTIALESNPARKAAIEAAEENAQ